MENNNYYPEQNGVQYEQPPQTEQYNQPAYAPYPVSPYEVAKKKNNSAPVLIGVAVILTELLSGLGTTIQSLIINILDAWNVSLASNNMQIIISNLASLIVVGGLGLLCYKNFRGALKFMGCYYLANTVAGFAVNIIYSIYYAVSMANTEAFYYRSQSTVGIISGAVYSILAIALSVVFIILLEKHIAKKEAAQNTVLNAPVDMYGNPVIKKDNFVTAAALASFLAVFINKIVGMISNTISAEFTLDMDGYGIVDHLKSTLFSTVAAMIFKVITIAVIIGVSYAMTKSASKTAKAFGCYMVGANVATIITNMVMFIFNLVLAEVISAHIISVVQLVMSIIAIPITAVVAFLVAKFSDDKKQTPAYNPAVY